VCVVSRKAQERSRKSERTEARRQAAVRKKRIRIGLIGGGAAVVVVLLAVLIFTGGATATGVTDPAAWDLPALETEERVALADFTGKPTVAVFFASWCAECWDELPGLATLAEELGTEVDFVGINSQDGGRGSGMASETGIDAWPVGRDVGGNDGRGLSTAFGARGMPLTVIYDASGNVIDVQLGAQHAPELRSKLQAFFQIG